MVDIKEFDRGETIRINNTFTDIDDAVFDPTTVELRIYDPSGTLIETVTYAADEIKKSSTGVYYYDYAIAADATVGWDITKWIGVASGFSDVSKGQFKVADPEEKLYVTVDEVWNRAGVTSTVASHDEVLPLIKASMSEIDSIYQKNFKYTNDVTEWFDTDCPDQNTVVNALFLTNTPVRAITSVKEYDTSGNEVADYEAADYRVDLKTGRIKLKSKEFGHDEDRVCVIYTYGHDTIPEKISTLCSVMSAMRLLVLQIGTTYDDVTSYGACGLSISVGEPAANMEKALIKLKDERNWLLAEIGRLRPSLMIV